MKILVGHKVTGGKNNGTSVDIGVVPVKDVHQRHLLQIMS